jgi:hypothetical protein
VATAAVHTLVSTISEKALLRVQSNPEWQIALEGNKLQDVWNLLCGCMDQKLGAKCLAGVSALASLVDMRMAGSLEDYIQQFYIQKAECIRLGIILQSDQVQAYQLIYGLDQRYSVFKSLVASQDPPIANVQAAVIAARNWPIDDSQSSFGAMATTSTYTSSYSSPRDSNVKTPAGYIMGELKPGNNYSDAQWRALSKDKKERVKKERLEEQKRKSLKAVPEKQKAKPRVETFVAENESSSEEDE